MNGTLPPPTFETARLTLAPPTLADEPAYRRHFVDREVALGLSDAIPWPYPEHGVRDYLRDRILPNQGRDTWFWGLVRREPAGFVNPAYTEREVWELTRREWEEGTGRERLTSM